MHTNETVNYGLSQFVGTDIPNPLVDYNGDMEKIDTAIKNVADGAVADRDAIAALEIQNGSETLDTTAQTLSGAVNELNTEYGDVNTRLTVAEGKITADEGTLATAVGNISTLAGKVSAVETKVGNAVLITTASDLSGAVNELKNEIDGSGVGSLDSRITALEEQNGNAVLETTAQTLSGAINELYNRPAGSVDADDVAYDNTTSGLAGTNVQSAIDEVNGKIPQSGNDISYNNTQSGLTATNVQSAIDELASDVKAPEVLATFTATNNNLTLSKSLADFSMIGVSFANETSGDIFVTNIIPINYFKTMNNGIHASYTVGTTEVVVAWVDNTHVKATYTGGAGNTGKIFAF